MVSFLRIKDEKALDILKIQSAIYKNLTFAFSKKYLASLKLALRHKHAFQLIALISDDKFVGYIACDEDLFPNFLTIKELFIHPSFQKQGIASRLLQKSINFAKEEGLKGVMTETEFENIPAQKLYEKCGLGKIDNPDWKEGVTYQTIF